MSISISRRAAIASAVALSTYSVAASHRARAAAPSLRIGDQKGGVEALLRAAGELDNAFYNIEFAQFPAAAPVLEALNAGAVDIAWAGDAPTTFALANGTPAHIVSAHRSNGAGTSLLVKTNSPIRTVADLKGRRIGTSRGSIGQALVLSALRANGLARTDVKFAFLLPAEARAALEADSVDAWSTWNVFAAQGKLVDRNRSIVDGSNGILSGLGFLNALDTSVVEKRAQVADFIARAARASRWSVAHPDEFSKYYANLIGVSFEVARLSFTTSPGVATPIDASVIADQQKTADLYVEAGLIASRIDVAKFFDPSFNASVKV